MPVPLTELGIGGLFAVMVIDRVLNWAVKFKNGRNGKDEKLKCVHSPEVKDALLNNILAKGSMERMEKHMENLSKGSTDQTIILKQSYEKLKEIARNSK